MSLIGDKLKVPYFKRTAIETRLTTSSKDV